MSDALDILKDFPAHTHAEWLDAAHKLLKGKPFDKVLIKKTYEGIDIQPMYFQADLEKLDHIDALPGQAPYVRGTTAAGDLKESWKIAQEITNPDPEEFNEAIVNDLSKGQDSLNIPFDKATRQGLNPDQAELDAVGVGGLSVASVNDLETALAGVDLTELPLLTHSGFSGVGMAALLAAFVAKQGGSVADLRGCLGVDPLGYLAVEGSLPISLEKSYDEMAQLTLWAKDNAPQLKTVCVHAEPYQYAGGNAVQEVTYAVATAVEYIRAMQKRGVDVDTAAKNIVFSFSIGADFFMEIAKFRAARMIWCQVAEAFGVGEEGQKMSIHARTSTWNKTHVDPWVNMLRVSTEAFSGIAGGVDSMHVGPFDEIFRQPNEFSRRIARNVHIVLKEEGHFDRVVDPAGGSWYVETITSQLAEKIWALFQEVESKGGFFAFLGEGMPQDQTTAVAAARLKNIAVRKDIFVGTNMYPYLEEKKVETYDFDFAAFQADRAEQVAAVAKGADVASLLDSVSGEQANMSGATVEAAVKAAAQGANLGELTAALRQGAEGSESVNPLNIHRGAEPFENIRRATEAYIEKTGEAPKLFLANNGPIPKHKARADFSTGFFNVAAFETIANTGFATPEEAADAALESGAKAVIITGTDDMYPDVVPVIAKKIKAAAPDVMVILAGYPKDHIEAFKEAGVDEFLHIRSNALELLGNLQKHMGVVA
ncbi:MAG: methylmalonyl-CoA mutase [Desulfobulbus propionicus]|nr:MAG: methylmalonyl-CoA mutase [Desulfobulbus propionicus]